MMPDIEQFVRENPYCSFERVHRVLELELDPRYGRTCIGLERSFADRIAAAAHFYTKDERGPHHGLVTAKDREAWYWDPALQQAEPLALHKVWAGQPQNAVAFPVIRGRWSVLRAMPLGGRSFSLTKYVPTLLEEEPSAEERNPLTQKLHFRFEENEFRDVPMDDFSLIRDEDGFSFACVQEDGSVVSFESPENEAPFVGKSHGPDHVRTYSEGELRECLVLVSQSTGIPVLDLEQKLDELPDLMNLFRFVNRV